MKVDIVMPQLGESVAEGTVLKWHKKVGDRVTKDEVIYEVSTDKIDTEIPAPVSGVLTEILVPEEKTVDVGTVVARIDTQTSDKVQPKTPESKPLKQVEAVKKEESKPHMGGESGKQETRMISRSRGVASSVGRAERPSALGIPPTRVLQQSPATVIRREKIFLSPVVRKMMKVHGIDASELVQVPGSGAQGRITRRDLESYLSSRGSTPRVSEKSTIAFDRPRGKAWVDTQPISQFSGNRVERMSNIRKKIAQHMVLSRQTSAHCQLYHEADVTDMMRYRELHLAEYASSGVKLTVTPLFLRPLMQAIREFPILNASVQGDEIVYHENINIGLAVALDKGLIVPVIKQAETLNLLGLAKAVQDLSTRARENKLNVDELQGGTFTLTNPGMYGTLMAAPIIHQPQVAIFSPGAIQKRVVVRGDYSLAIRDMVYLSLSFDHRVIDGAVAGAFLKSLTQKLEQSFSFEP